MVMADIHRACHVLFGIPSGEAAGLLVALDGVRLKGAYRRAARRTHPDLFGHLPDAERRERTEAFIQAGEAYRILVAFLGRRRAAFPVPAPPNREISRYPAGRGIPDRPLRFGEFLVHSGVVSWGALTRAIVWQRSAAPRLGQIAKDWRWITEGAIEAALPQRAAGELLGALLMRHGLLAPIQLRILMRHQEKSRPRLGTYFIAQGLLSPERLQRYLQLLASHNACCKLRRG